MILSKFVEVKVMYLNQLYYSNLGYDINNKKILVDIKDLPLGSRIVIDVQCDYCGIKKQAKFREYIKSERNKGYSCAKCNKIKTKVTNLERFGYEYPLQHPDKIEKQKKTYSDSLLSGKLDLMLENKKIKCLEQHGVEYYIQSKEFLVKFKEKFMLLYGFDNPMKVKTIKEKAIKTCFERFGVGYPNQNEDIFTQGQKTRFNILEFGNTKLFYRGSYEYDFLNVYYYKYEIKKGIRIEYRFDKVRYYFSDFYLPEFNLIVEIKSSYTYLVELEQNKAKEKACLDLGYKFIFIINKNYTEFVSLINSLKK